MVNDDTRVMILCRSCGNYSSLSSMPSVSPSSENHQFRLFCPRCGVDRQYGLQDFVKSTPRKLPAKKLPSA